MNTDFIAQNCVKNTLELYNLSSDFSKSLIRLRCLLWLSLAAITFSHVMVTWGRSLNICWFLLAAVGTVTAVLSYCLTYRSMFKSQYCLEDNIGTVVFGFLYICLMYRSFVVIFSEQDYSWGAWLTPIVSVVLLFFSGQAFFNELHRLAFVNRGLHKTSLISELKEDFTKAMFEHVPQTQDRALFWGDTLFCIGVFLASSWSAMAIAYHTDNTSVAVIELAIYCVTMLYGYRPMRWSVKLPKSLDVAVFFIALAFICGFAWLCSLIGDYIFSNLTPVIILSVLICIYGIVVRYKSKNILYPHQMSDVEGGIFVVTCLLCGICTMQDYGNFFNELGLIFDLGLATATLFWWFIKVVFRNYDANYEYEFERSLYMKSPETYQNSMYPYKIFANQGTNGKGRSFLKLTYKKAVKDWIKREHISECLLLQYKSGNTLLTHDNIRQLDADIEQLPETFDTQVFFLDEDDYNAILGTQITFDEKFNNPKATVMALVFPQSKLPHFNNQ
jgi:hypothetical protein